MRDESRLIMHWKILQQGWRFIKIAVSWRIVERTR